MIRFLRQLPIEMRRKVAMVIAGGISASIFVFWLLHSFGTLGPIFVKTREQSLAAIGFLDQNVEIAYNAFTEVKGRVFTVETIPDATTTATSTSFNASTTTE